MVGLDARQSTGPSKGSSHLLPRLVTQKMCGIGCVDSSPSGIRERLATKTYQSPSYSEGENSHTASLQYFGYVRLTHWTASDFDRIDAADGAHPASAIAIVSKDAAFMTPNVQGQGPGAALCARSPAPQGWGSPLRPPQKHPVAIEHTVRHIDGAEATLVIHSERCPSLGYVVHGVLAEQRVLD